MRSEGLFLDARGAGLCNGGFKECKPVVRVPVEESHLAGRAAAHYFVVDAVVNLVTPAVKHREVGKVGAIETLVGVLRCLTERLRPYLSL